MKSAYSSISAAQRSNSFACSSIHGSIRSVVSGAKVRRTSARPRALAAFCSGLSFAVGGAGGFGAGCVFGSVGPCRLCLCFSPFLGTRRGAGVTRPARAFGNAACFALSAGLGSERRADAFRAARPITGTTGGSTGAAMAKGCGAGFPMQKCAFTSHGTRCSHT